MRHRTAVLTQFVAFTSFLVAALPADAYELGEDLSVGGRLFGDVAWRSTEGQSTGRMPDWNRSQGEFRRLRLFAAGTVHDRLTFKLQFDFAGGEAALKDAYIGAVELPVVGTVKVGHFKEPFSLEELTSSKYLLAMERAMVVDALAPGRNTGLAVGTSLLDERLTWRVGAFRNADKYGRFAAGGGSGVTGRVTGLAWRNDDRRLHLGLAYSHRIPNRATDEGSNRRLFDPAARPESHLAPVGLEVPGDGLSASRLDLIGLEALSMAGPWTLAVEYMGAHVQSASTSTGRSPYLGGWNTALSVFATGERRPYDASDGTLSRPHPKRPFLNGGPGAWELVARFSYLDFWEAGANAIWNATGGVNWYWSSRARMMVNYGLGTPNYTDGPEHIVQTRVQLDF